MARRGGANNNQIRIGVEVDASDVNNIAPAVEAVLRRNAEAEARYQAVSAQIRARNVNLTDQQLRQITQATIRELDRRSTAERRALDQALNESRRQGQEAIRIQQQRTREAEREANRRATAERRMEEQLARDIARIQRDRSARETALNAQRLREAQALQTAVRNAERRAIQNVITPQRSGGSGGNFLQGAGTLLSGAGLGNLGSLAAAAGPAAALAAALALVGIGFSKFIDLSQQAIDKSVESARSNRLLSSSATEAGLTYKDLSEKNREFAKAVGLSDVAAAKTTARIAQLARAGAQPQNIKKLLGSFADLGAARGLESNSLEAIIQQIQSGQDEGLNKLGLPDPSVLYRRYQKANNIQGELDQFQKVTAATEAVIKKSEIFKGAAQARMESLEGSVARLTSVWDNFTTSLSNSFAQSREVGQVLKGLNAIVNKLQIDTEALNKEMAEGASPAALAKKSAGGFSAFDTVKGLIGISQAAQLAAITGGNAPKGSGFFDSVYRFASGYENQDREQETLRQLNATKLLTALQEKSAKDQQAALREEIALIKEKNQQTENSANILKRIGNKYTSLDELKQIRNQIFSQTILTDGDKALGLTMPRLTKEQAAQIFEAAAEAGAQLVEKRFREAIEKSKNSISELKKQLSQVEVDTNIDPDAKNSLIKSIRDRLVEIRKELEAGVDKFRQSLVDFRSRDNNLLRALDSYSTSAKRARDEFKQFGDEVVKTQTRINQASALRDINKIVYENEKRAISSDFEARKLENLPASQTDGFARRLDLAAKSLEYFTKNVELLGEIEKADYIGSLNPNNPRRFIPSERLIINKNAYRDALGNEKVFYTDGVIDNLSFALKRISQIDNLDLYGTGVQGKALSADAKLALLPDTNVLLGKLRDPRYYDQADRLLKIRGELLRDKKAGEDEKFNNALLNNKFAEDQRQYATDLVRNVKNSKLTAAERRAEILAITRDLGTAELTPELRREAIRAGKEDAIEDRKLRQEAATYLKSIEKEIRSLKAQIDSKGLPIDVGDQPLMNLNVRGENVEIREKESSNARTPNQQDVQIQMGFFSNEGGLRNR